MPDECPICQGTGFELKTGEGGVVVNGGAAYVLAEALHKEIQAITDQPVKLVFNENGQGHAMLLVRLHPLACMRDGQCLLDAHAGSSR